jgi:hypothetical protein
MSGYPNNEPSRANILHNVKLCWRSRTSSDPLFRCIVSIQRIQIIVWCAYIKRTDSWSWALLERPPVVRALDSFPAFYGTRRFITAFTRALHCPYPEADQSSSHQPIPPLQGPWPYFTAVIFIGKAEENHDKLQSGQPASGPIYQVGIYITFIRLERLKKTTINLSEDRRPQALYTRLEYKSLLPGWKGWRKPR